jgi:long-chain acyl-CoA synthetase
VEEALLEINEIHEAAVIGVDDPILGEAIKAFIVLRNGAEVSAEDIGKTLKDMLPPYKHPKYYQFRDRLPKNQAGKVLKTVLKEEQQVT